MAILCTLACRSRISAAEAHIRLDESLEELLDRVCQETGRSRSEVVRDALRRTLSQKLRLSSEALATVEAVLDRFPAVSGDQAPSPLRLRDPEDERVLGREHDLPSLPSSDAGICRVQPTGPSSAVERGPKKSPRNLLRDDAADS